MAVVYLIRLRASYAAYHFMGVLFCIIGIFKCLLEVRVYFYCKKH